MYFIAIARKAELTHRSGGAKFRGSGFGSGVPAGHGTCQTGLQLTHLGRDGFRLLRAQLGLFGGDQGISGALEVARAHRCLRFSDSRVR